MITTAELCLDQLPATGVDLQSLFAFAHTFDGYGVWGGFAPCVLVGNHTLTSWEAARELPTELTVLRTALFFEARRERFVDFGGFGDDPAGWAEHHAYMRELLERIRQRLQDAGSRNMNEDEVVTDWLDAHPPADPPAPEDHDPAPPVDDEVLAAAVSLAARMVGVDFRRETVVDEDRLRDRLRLALRHLAPVDVRAELHVPVIGFQGVGGVDLVLHQPKTTDVCGLIECKWSVDLKRDKIYEGAWDAIKLSLAKGDFDRWLVTGAPAQAWSATETPDLFGDDSIDTHELWHRPLHTRGPNGGNTVGEDCELGGRGNRFVDAPQLLAIKLVTVATVPDTDRVIKASRILGDGPMVHFNDPPEFPPRITQAWLEANVPAMPPDQFERLLAWLELKRWPPALLAERVTPLRENIL